MSGLFWFLLKRAGWMLLTLWIVFTATFFLMRAVPGNPFNSERAMSPAKEQQMRQRYNMDGTPLEQYVSVLGRTVQGDLGTSSKLEDYTVNEIIAEGFPVSASLAIFALAFAVIFGVSAGVISAVYRGTSADFSMMVGAVLGVAIPNFVVASVAILLFVFEVAIFPAAGFGTLQQIILPALCLGAPLAAYIARLCRAGMLEALNREHVRTAFAKGLPKHVVILRHALPAALLPVVSYLGPAVARVLTGSLVLEKIFALPGMGSHFIEAAFQRDYPLAIGVVLVYTILLFTMNTIVDIAYAVIDPRVKLQ